MDNLTDLRVNGRELNERGFRFVKAPASLLLDLGEERAGDIHPADVSDLLARFGKALVCGSGIALHAAEQAFPKATR